MDVNYAASISNRRIAGFLALDAELHAPDLKGAPVSVGILAAAASTTRQGSSRATLWEGIG